MRTPQTFLGLLGIPAVSAVGCSWQPEGQPGPDGAPAPASPEHSSASGECKLYQWYSFSTGACGATTIETHPVDESVRDTWIDACKEITAKTLFLDTSVMDGDIPSDALCDFQFKINSLPSSGAVYIGSKDLSDLAHDMPSWAGPDNQSVGGKMSCSAPGQPDSNHAEIEWQIVPFQS
ncbi:hypothetical protein F5X99DRAFT_407225 [Biscogniauxia marginata]|nr:hypothetical protein F5X99DRAFT_407225 [Biscogniauxia marginata]